jgi:hypothetical protein
MHVPSAAVAQAAQAPHSGNRFRINIQIALCTYILYSHPPKSNRYINHLPMRFPSLPTLIRTFHTFANTTVRANHAFNISRLYNPTPRVTVLQSMPLPFLGALFGSSSKMADNTNYPVQKTEGEWQAVLSPGTSFTIPRTPDDWL